MVRDEVRELVRKLALESARREEAERQLQKYMFINRHSVVFPLAPQLVQFINNVKQFATQVNLFADKLLQLNDLHDDEEDLPNTDADAFTTSSPSSPKASHPTHRTVDKSLFSGEPHPSAFSPVRSADIRLKSPAESIVSSDPHLKLVSMENTAESSTVTRSKSPVSLTRHSSLQDTTQVSDDVHMKNSGPSNISIERKDAAPSALGGFKDTNSQVMSGKRSHFEKSSDQLRESRILKNTSSPTSTLRSYPSAPTSKTDSHVRQEVAFVDDDDGSSMDLSTTRELVMNQTKTVPIPQSKAPSIQKSSEQSVVDTSISKKRGKSESSLSDSLLPFVEKPHKIAKTDQILPATHSELLELKEPVSVRLSFITKYCKNFQVNGVCLDAHCKFTHQCFLCNSYTHHLKLCGFSIQNPHPSSTLHNSSSPPKISSNVDTTDSHDRSRSTASIGLSREVSITSDTSIEYCEPFNLVEVCPRSVCTQRHACSVCNSFAHGAINCPKA